MPLLLIAKEGAPTRRWFRKWKRDSTSCRRSRRSPGRCARSNSGNSKRRRRHCRTDRRRRRRRRRRQRRSATRTTPGRWEGKPTPHCRPGPPGRARRSPRAHCRWARPSRSRLSVDVSPVATVRAIQESSARDAAAAMARIARPAVAVNGMMERLVTGVRLCRGGFYFPASRRRHDHPAAASINTPPAANSASVDGSGTTTGS